jgi:phosphomevalonate kinase
MTTITAPGKLMIAGEYAVLDGAPAIVLAVDRGVRCDITVHDTLLIETPDGDDRFVRPPLLGHIGHYRFSAWNPTELPEKPGFGGSAAACVAACLAAGLPTQDAVQIHHTVQGGGSGADVLASALGGMLRVQHGTATPLTPIRPVVIWSGQSAQTQPRLLHYLSATNRDAFVRESTEIVDAFSDDPLAMLAENAQLLMHMSVETGLPYMTPALASIRTLAKKFGGVAKPSGAGGGDCAIALFPDPDAEDAFVAELEKRGRVHIPIAVAGPARLMDPPEMA